MKRGELQRHLLDLRERLYALEQRLEALEVAAGEAQLPLIDEEGIFYCAGCGDVVVDHIGDLCVNCAIPPPRAVQVADPLTVAHVRSQRGMDIVRL